MAKKEVEETKNPDITAPDWIGEFAKISLLADFIKRAFDNNCDCDNCRRLRDMAKGFENLVKLPKQ